MAASSACSIWSAASFSSSWNRWVILLANSPAGAARAAGPREHPFLVLLFASFAGEKKHQKIFEGLALQTSRVSEVENGTTKVAYYVHLTAMFYDGAGAFVVT